MSDNGNGRHHPHWLKAYVNYTRASEAPTAFHFWTGVSTIAGALRRRVWIDEKYFQWTPNFYIVFVAPPGVATKSTTVRFGMQLLKKLKTIKFGPKSMTWQSLATSLEAAIETVKYPGIDGVEVKHVMSCLTIPISELGTFLKPDDGALMDVLIDLYDGQLETFDHATKTQGTTTVENPWLNVIGCTTPSWLKDNFPESMIGGGLTSRVIFVFGDTKRQFVAYPSRHIEEVSFEEEGKRLVDDLHIISTMCGRFRLSEEAIEWGEVWYKKHWTEPRPKHLASDRFGGYIARKQTHVHKLAMILSAAKRSTLIIEREDIEEADALITATEPDMLKVFESIGVVDEARHVKEIYTYVKSYGFISAPDLWRLCISIMSFQQFEIAIRAATEAGMLMSVNRDGKRGLICIDLHQKKEAGT